MALENVNPNQMALTGMESPHRPWERFLAEGYSFGFFKGETHLAGKPTGKKQKLLARYESPDSIVRRKAAELDWAGADQKTAAYPGEINWVHTEPADRGKGLASAMYRMAHRVNLGQDTVPLHSKDRTIHGDAFARKNRTPHHPLSREEQRDLDMEGSPTWGDMKLATPTTDDVTTYGRDPDMPSPKVEMLHPYRQQEAEEHQRQQANRVVNPNQMQFRW